MRHEQVTRKLLSVPPLVGALLLVAISAAYADPRVAPWRDEELNENFMRSLTKSQCMTKTVAALMAGCSSTQCLKSLGGVTGDCVTLARGDTASFCAGYEREYIASYCATKQPDPQICTFLTVAESTLCAASVAAASGPDGLFSYGDWRSNIVPNENGWTLASTKNDNGEFLSKYCQVNNACLWRIDASVGPCDKNDQSRILINGGGVLEGSTVTCLGKVNENWVWRIEDRHAIENVLKRSTAVTITFPLDDSVHLREIGFSGRGAVNATAKIGAPIVGGQRERTQDVTY